jgi:hypothetical protein
MRQTFKCKNCGKEKTGYGRRFCSSACFGKDYARTRTAARICPVCETNFIVPNSRLYLVKNIHCSKECANVGLRSKAGKGLNKNGYVVLYTPEGPKLEHRVVMQNILGRPLKKNETVHHKNGIRSDNRPENLELWAGNHGPHQRVEDLITFAKNLLTEHGYTVTKQIAA